MGPSRVSERGEVLRPVGWRIVLDRRHVDASVMAVAMASTERGLRTGVKAASQYADRTSPKRRPLSYWASGRALLFRVRQSVMVRCLPSPRPSTSLSVHKSTMPKPRNADGGRLAPAMNLNSVKVYNLSSVGKALPAWLSAGKRKALVQKKEDNERRRSL